MERNVYADHEIWFVSGSQHLYGREILEQVSEDARKIVEGLNETGGFALPIVPRARVTTSDEILRTLREASAEDLCVGVIVWMHTFSPAKMWINGLSELTKPLLQLHTQYNRGIPWDSIDMDFMNLNQTAHGGREFGFLGSRLRMERKVVVGHWSDAAVHRKLDRWIRAAAAYADGKQLRVARLGDNMREVAVTEGDKVEAQRVFGYSVNGYGLADLTAAMNEISPAEIDRLVQEYSDTYTISVDLTDAVALQRVREAARIELGLRRFLAAGGFGAFTDTFENLAGMSQLPGIAVQRLMAEGVGFGAEGDWKTAALLRAMKVMERGLPGGTSFMEDYTYHFDEERPLVLGAHMLEVCPSIAQGPVNLEIHPLGIGGKDDPVRLVFDGGGGPAINVSLTDMGNRFRLVVNDVEAVAPPRELPNLPVARVVWEPKPDLSTAAAAWIHAGGAHHTGFSRSLTKEHIRDYASMVGVELIEIGEESRLEDIVNALRWNDVYYRMGRI